MYTTLLYAFLGTMFPFILTTLGSALVLFLKKQPTKSFERILLGLGDCG